VAQVLDRFGIAIRAGHHCTMPLHERLDLAATARASFSVYTTTSDVDALIKGLHEVVRIFGAGESTNITSGAPAATAH
jgi:cysteine desulfurase/selenocysteine lyase